MTPLGFHPDADSEMMEAAAYYESLPFNVLFRTTPDQIIIMAVMHQSRHPDYWKNR